jgi:mannose-6-phosphate isomerase-like protein (cupin superfamily)
MLVKTIADCAEFTAGDRTLLREVLVPAADRLPLHYSIAHARLPPLTWSTAHRLRGTEVYVLLAGTGTISVAGEERRVGAGDVVYVPPGAVQHLRNDSGSEDLVFLCIVDPPWRGEDEEILDQELRPAATDRSGE